MTEPDDRELERYLKGDSPMSRRYREASAETTPPALDEDVLARARAAPGRKPGRGSRWLSGLALAASVLLAVNLGWNLRQVEPVSPASQKSRATEDAVAPEPRLEERPAARQVAPAEAPVAQAQPKRSTEDRERAAARPEQESARRDLMARSAEQQPGPAAAPAAPTPLTETAKIDHLISHVAGLPGAVFIRNGKEHGAPDAAQHLQFKREKAGARVKTADDFIRLCASRSYTSGEAYLIRFADGRTRTAEDVLREELARLEAR